ncbi:MAG: hypothetical protein N2508_01490 [Anaerolineae bacterium]|nr:hypothetical protein [Anaerolineae bacterium]
MRRQSQFLTRALNPANVAHWMRSLSGEQRAAIEALAVRRDMVALLTYLRDHRVTGTQSTGNFPLKAVREITACFVNPPQLDFTVGEHTFRLRSEDDVWPLIFLHHLACSGALIEGGPGRRWRLTSLGEEFLAIPPPVQVWLMVYIWWSQVNWLIAFPFQGLGETLPPQFKETTLHHLLALPVDTSTSVDAFASRLIKATGLQWRARDSSNAQMFLHAAVSRMVIYILADFGLIEVKYRKKETGLLTFEEAVAFKMTAFGHGLLETLK